MMSKQWVLSSLMSSTNPESTDDNGGLVGTSLGLKRVRDGHLYDGDGRPLKGFKREVAKLLYDNRHLGESDLHRLEQSLSDGNRVACTASDAGARSGEPRRSIFQRFPVLPDMFGVVSGAASAVKSCKALGGDGGDLRCTVPAGSRWSLVQRRHTRLKRMVEDIGSSSDDIVNPKDFPSAHVEGTGYRWVRADSLQVEEALAQSLLATPAVTLGEGCFSLNAGGTPGTTRGENTRNGSNTSWISHVCTFAPPEAELSIVGARFGTDLFGFFTLNEEEYATLGLDSASYQPSFVSRPNGSEETTLWSFDYETTVKLLTLYERFGNFVLVADRWVFTNSDGTAPAEARGAGDPVLPPPPVEALMERYKLVSEAILQHRLRLLKGALDNINGHGGGTATSASKHHKGQQGKESCAADKGKTKDTEDERAIASTHPLVTLMGKHPILEAQRRRQEWLAQSLKTHPV
uniref:Uncharacterized protein n=1 Tax=Trypanosoma congolense (strain IL3000) TaxID=1068625 RepID=G0UQ51_TRYCI|nr:conserved hypothetical protein [Trypanosoma congolense IL3000]